MSRDLSVDFRKALTDERSGEVVALLLTIYHPSLPDGDILLSSDNAVLLDYDTQQRGTISQGRTFRFMPMQFGLPEEDEGVVPTLQVTFYDVGAEVVPLLEATTSPALVTTEMILASAPDRIEIRFAVFELSTADVTKESVTLSLTVDTMSAEPFPADCFTPGTFPGLWSSY